MDTRGNNIIVRFIPNALTLGRLFLTVVFLAMILYAPQTGKDKPSGFLLTAFILFVVTGVTDIVDGIDHYRQGNIRYGPASSG